jgi:hypothetical protein
VGEGQAEHRHHGVADELLDSPAVQLDDALHPLEVAGQHGAQRLRVHRLAERRRAGDIAEDDRDRLPDAGSRIHTQGPAAGPAEAEALGIHLPA